MRISAQAVAFLLMWSASLCGRSEPFESDRWRIASIPLDIPLDSQSALNGQALEGLYQGVYGAKMPHNFGGYIGKSLRSSVLIESPFYHIQSSLQDERKLELWFSSAEDGRRIFGVRLTLPYSKRRKATLEDTIAELRTAFGPPDLTLKSSALAAQAVLVIADRTVPPERYQAIVARVPEAAATSIDALWNVELRRYAEILGSEFRGIVATLSSESGSNRLASGSALLLDLKRAGTVFNLAPQP